MRLARSVVALCSLTLAASGCSAIYSFDEFHVGSADAALADGARLDASTPDGGDAGVRDGGTDAGLICTGTMADCNGDGTSCETDLSSDRANCGGCGAGHACPDTDGCWAGACDSVTKLAPGHAHTCALLASGRVACWGYNDHGQLGDGTRTSSPRPVVVEGLVASDVAAGYAHTCAVLGDTSTGVVCWGANPDGRLGVAAGDDVLLPPRAPIAALPNARAVSVGRAHSCALASGGVYCWGSNAHRQLALDPTTTPSSAIPQSVSTGVPVSIDAGADTTCAVTDSMSLVCWGSNVHGERGIGDVRDEALLPIVTGTGVAPRLITQVSVGDGHVCAVDNSHGGYCWGANTAGALGVRSSAAYVPTLTALPPIGGIAEIAAGYASTCARTTANRVACWGSNADGALGLGTADDSPHNGDTVDLLPGVMDATAIAHGGFTPCALKGHTVLCWGSNAWGQAGASIDTLQATTPQHVTGLVGVTRLAAGSQHACALGSSISCWGANSTFQLGVAASHAPRSMPAMLSAPTGGGTIAAIAAGESHTCAVGTAPPVSAPAGWCWGSDERGQLGLASTIAQSAPTPVTGAGAPTVVGAGPDHSCFANGSLHLLQCFGLDDAGQAGARPGGNNVVDVPQLVGGLPMDASVVEIAAGARHTCVVARTTASTDVYCFGDNTGDTLGVADSGIVEVAEIVPGTSDASHVVAGDGFTCALTSGGQVSCWGRNGRGELGSTATDPTGSPTEVTSARGATAIAAGRHHVCAVVSGAGVMCWGANDEGQLGDGTLTGGPDPRVVPATTAIATLAAGADFTCGVTTGGSVSCWGSRTTGKLADAMTLSAPMPTAVVGTAP